MRLFIALDLPEPIKDELHENAELLRMFCDRGHFSPRENYHITLAFLGEQPESRVADLTAAMDCCETESFPVTFEGLGEFENGVVWRGIEASGKLMQLQRELTDQLRLRNFDLECRKYRPHLTLARRVILKEKILLSDLSGQIKPLSFQVDKMTLMCSELSNAGSIYTPMYESVLFTGARHEL